MPLVLVLVEPTGGFVDAAASETPGISFEGWEKGVALKHT